MAIDWWLCPHAGIVARCYANSVWHRVILVIPIHPSSCVFPCICTEQLRRLASSAASRTRRTKSFCGRGKMMAMTTHSLGAVLRLSNCFLTSSSLLPSCILHRLRWNCPLSLFLSVSFNDLVGDLRRFEPLLKSILSNMSAGSLPLSEYPYLR